IVNLGHWETLNGRGGMVRLRRVAQPNEASRNPLSLRKRRYVKKLNFYSGTIDGIFGSKTEEAVINFQKSQQLLPDGIVGEKTWAKLKEALQEDNPRSNFRVINVIEFISSNRIRNFNPKAVATQLFSSVEEGEGRRLEEISVTYPTTETAVILHTIVGLADDSVNGWRYRVELERNQNQWEIIWVGLQTKCHQNRGHQDWSDGVCS
ncbi:MAG: peptidoglycan-binding domain-containing protein, partial [Rivularia sp. (in: cyanobacteria)]